MEKKRELGDGVSIEWDGDGLLLSADITGDEPQQILLEPKHITGIQQYLNDFKAATLRGEVIN